MIKFYVFDKMTNEKMEVKTMKYYDYKMPATVLVLANPQPEKGGWTSYDYRRIKLNELIPDDTKENFWELERRYKLIMEGEA
ncbi:hypothetical protein Y272_08700 [Listeria monocytogenes]|nr:hypothetical protein [Listeria monocytogenes]EAD6813458.1 hypothetical protein [Listeria monocytogenes]EAE1620007.1 hypothetical protein [Listeria monocytogenes]HAC4710093.1 hypothetical protein [Listeria monocytogenes]HAC4713336.1 hypothetical protein [Listeria monocytogenes]